MAAAEWIAAELLNSGSASEPGVTGDPATGHLVREQLDLDAGSKQRLP
ncbi:MAG: hypothetical protein JWL97_3854 [Gemmatimonadales bacterium]|jgi:hypothetical protein|nr:hypothetical protein [Gemmatimonadales bacterium]